jgi:hypothetical protein
MPFINAAMDDVREDKPVEEGEYDLRITSVKEKESKKGQPMLEVMLKIEGREGEGASPIWHYLLFNSPDQAAARMQALDLKRFLTLFNVPVDPNGFNSDDLVGATASCMVIQEEDDRGNIRNALRLPRLQD